MSTDPKKRPGADGSSHRGGAAEKTGPPSGHLDDARPTSDDLSSPTEQETQNKRKPLPPAAAAGPAVSRTSFPTAQTSATRGATQPDDAAGPNAKARLDPNVQALINEGLLSVPDAPAIRRGAMAVVNGRYELTKQLGMGGMGMVYLAYDRVGDCEVALKTLKPRFYRNASARASFIQEAKEMNRIPAHARVLVVKDFGSVDQPYYVTEVLTGGSLGDVIRKRGALPAEECRRYARDLATAIGYIHAKQGKVHRDVKPENLLLDAEQSAWLADFGLIWEVGGGSRGLRAGTLPYMPPEVVGDSRKNVGYEWDVYSFGATLYEMLTGFAPYSDVVQPTPPKKKKDAEEASPMERLKRAITQSPPTPILKRNRRADKNLTRVAEWAMARDARDRYFHVDHILNDLSAIEQGRKPLGPLQKNAVKQEAGSSRSRWSGWLLTAVTILSVGAAVALVLFESDLRPTVQTVRSSAMSWLGMESAAALDDTKVETDDIPAIFEQTPIANTGDFTFDTLEGRREFLPADAATLHQAQTIGFREGELPTEHALFFTMQSEAGGYLTVLVEDQFGDITRLIPQDADDYFTLPPGERITLPAQPRPDSPTRAIWIQGPAGSLQVRAILTPEPFEFELPGDDTQADASADRFIRERSAIRVNGQTYRSLYDAFGDRWQVSDLRLQVIE
jgi:serine/threonine protein kinase